MFLAWLMTISLFLACIYTTIVIFDRLKERDASDLAQLQAQLEKMGMDHKRMKKAM
ncbi:MULTISPECIES: hypothetical protein [Neobacillus]|jgi:hypothetical protein|uniref:Uncharacterized protein n=1 Tax=Neobacillus sedimentimangrovi TaxID=2699460 RepID=A0ABS8QID1_9BACI|nr:hypothetical protein [Neobacillus sedimentimangrovi]MCD4838364.1 hypothetical protein [Neobacillus sedimentimangrovi]